VKKTRFLRRSYCGAQKKVKKTQCTGVIADFLPHFFTFFAFSAKVEKVLCRGFAEHFFHFFSKFSKFLQNFQKKVKKSALQSSAEALQSTFFTFFSKFSKIFTKFCKSCVCKAKD
jgi:hypothetical protein